MGPDKLQNCSNFRKKHSYDRHNFPNGDSVNEIGNNLTLVQDWGKKMASLFIKEASDCEKEGPHVVILPCPSSLDPATSLLGYEGLSGIEKCYKNSYSKHLGYHVGVSFAREVASFIDDFVTVILPHGFLVPKAKPTHYGYTYKTRDYLLHNPSDEALSSICTAKNIHIIDDNMVYGSTQARMIVGAFLACEEVGNFDAKLHSHTWFSRMINTRVGSTTKDIILEATRNIDFVKGEDGHIRWHQRIEDGEIDRSGRRLWKYHAFERPQPPYYWSSHIPNSLEGRPLFQDSFGVFGMHWSGKIVHESESFWDADPYSFAIEAPKVTDEAFFGIDESEELVASTPDEETSLWILRTKRGREELQRMLEDPYEKEEREFLSELVERRDRAYKIWESYGPIYDMLLQFQKKIRRVEKVSSQLLTMIGEIKRHLNGALPGFKKNNRYYDGKWLSAGYDLKPSKESDWRELEPICRERGESPFGIVRRGFKESQEFRDIVSPWEEYVYPIEDLTEWCNDFSTRLDDCLAANLSMIREDIHIRDNKYNLDREIRDIYIEDLRCADNWWRKFNVVRKKFPDHKNLKRTHELRLEETSMIEQIREITWQVSLLWDTDEKVKKGETLEKRSDELISEIRDGKHTSDHYELALISADFNNLRAKFSRENRVLRERIESLTEQIGLFWKSNEFLTEEDLDFRKKVARGANSETLEIIYGILIKMEDIVHRNRDLIGRFREKGGDSVVEEFRTFSEKFR